MGSPVADRSREEELRRFEALAHASPGFSAIVAMNGTVEFVNRAGRELIGMATGTDVRTTSIGDYLTSETATARSTGERPALDRYGYWAHTGSLRDWSGGPPIPADISSFVLADQQTGEPLAVAMTGLDLRPRLAADEAMADVRPAPRRIEDRQKALLMNMSDLLVLIGADGTVRDASPSAGPSLGYEAGSKKGTNVYELIHPDDKSRIAARLRDVLAQPGLSPPMDVRLLSADRTWRRYEIIANNLLDDPSVEGIVVAARDVTARHVAERALASQARILELIAQGTSLTKVLGALAEEVENNASDIRCSILLVEPSANGPTLRLSAAPSMPEEYRLAVDGLLVGPGISPCSLAAATNEAVLVADLFADPAWAASKDLATVIGVRACWSVPVRSPATDATIGTFELYQTTPGLPGPEILALVERAGHLIGIAVDRARFEERLAYQASHDDLTLLANRTLLLERLESALERHCEESGVVPVLVFVDIDRLKVINDSLGHDVGDAFLVHIARRLEAGIGPTDTVARFGGDEFVVVSETRDLETGPAQIVEGILRMISAPIELSGRTIAPSASAGVVIAAGYDSATAVIRDADIAMYRAKHRGGSGYEIFDSSMRDRAMARLDLEAEIRQGIGRGEFVVMYQPMVDLLDRRVVGFEALVRWNHPVRGLLGPAAFIELAEETGLIIELGEWVLQEAVRTVSSWGEKSERDGLMLSVNVSSRQLTSSTLLSGVTSAIDAIRPWSLYLELTESTLMDDTPKARSMIDALTSAGTCLSIDDFGTGYSSLSYLTRLPVTTLKIDQSFVAALGVIGEAETVAAAIVSLGQQLGLKVVAEGVETPDQERALLALGCRMAQGFLFHRPLPASEAKALLPG
ncbi:MAG: hypothetical protein NVS3B12_33400 [Acidimicrobiales bacterium]